jgi:Caspase domain
MTYRALLIGNSVFDKDAGLNPLNAPVKDVARLHRALVDAETGLFDDDMVRLVTERTCDDILDELDRFFGTGEKEDLLLLYYSGHGVLDERNNLYLCGRDTRSDRLLRTAVSNVRVNEFVTQSMSQRIVIVLDCCASGMFKGASVGPQLAGPGRYIVSSTRGSHLANDAASATGTSLFTEHLVEGMLGAAIDGNGDGYIDLREIYDYVRDRLLATTKQVPHCRFDGDAAVSLARVRMAIAPVIARAVPEGQARSHEPTFALAENTITLRDIEPDEPLAPEVVDVIQLGDEPLDLVARTDNDWLETTVSEDKVTVVLRPRPGPNRGKVIVRDRNSRSAQVLRVEAHARSAAAPAAATAAVAGGGKGAVPDPETRLADPVPDPALDVSVGPSVPTQQDWSPPPTPPQPFAAPASYRPRPAAATAFIRSVSWIGVGAAAVGGVLLVIAFSGATWYAGDGQTVSAHDLNTLASAVRAGPAHAYFGGWDWPLVLAVIGCGIGACLVPGHGSRLLARLGLVLGVVGIGVTVGALAQMWHAAEQHGTSDVGVFKHTADGLWLALVGYLLAGIAGLLRRRRVRP